MGYGQGGQIECINREVAHLLGLPFNEVISTCVYYMLLFPVRQDSGQQNFVTFRKS